MTLKSGWDHQHVFTSQLPERPWHLHLRCMSSIIDWKRGEERKRRRKMLACNQNTYCVPLFSQDFLKNCSVNRCIYTLVDKNHLILQSMPCTDAGSETDKTSATLLFSVTISDSHPNFKHLPSAFTKGWSYFCAYQLLSYQCLWVNIAVLSPRNTIQTHLGREEDRSLLKQCFCKWNAHLLHWKLNKYEMS